MAPQRTVEEAPIHGDILEVIFSHVPLIHLLPASRVSKAWNHAVFSSLSHFNPIKPWLLVFTQNPRAPHVTALHAYDPRSRVWLQISHDLPTTNRHASAVRSSHSTLLYTLTPAAFAFSSDALHLSWHHAPAPRVWRTDPIVARVGKRVVVAGGACEFEDDPLAVEVYDMETKLWVTCQSMPDMLKGSTSSTWLSVAVAGDKMLVTEKNSGVTYSFDVIANIWNGPYYMKPDQSVVYCVTGTLGRRLMVAGVVEVENRSGMKLWEVRGELGSEWWFEELGEMPKEMVEKVKSCWELDSIEVNWVGDFVYVTNPLQPEEVVVCKVGSGSDCEWWSVRNAVVNDDVMMERMVVTGGDVCMEDLQKVAASENSRFSDFA